MKEKSRRILANISAMMIIVCSGNKAQSCEQTRRVYRTKNDNARIQRAQKGAANAELLLALLQSASSSIHKEVPLLEEKVSRIIPPFFFVGVFDTCIVEQRCLLCLHDTFLFI